MLVPSVLPLCFSSGENIACPTDQIVVPTAGAASQGADSASTAQSLADADNVARAAASTWDIALVELLGVMAAALSAGIALRGFQRRRSPYDFPRLLALIKLPTGALTAVLGLLLIRAQFIPGLSALDSATQIVAWAVVLGYSQQIFTRLIDQRAQTVLNEVETTPDTGSTRRDPSRVEPVADATK